MNDAIALIRVVDLTKRYGSVTALSGLELQIAKGEIFGILGPNGAGKTTLIRILATLTRQSSGQAFVGGYDVMQQPVQAKRQIGVVHQTLNIDPELTAEESLRIHGMLFGLSQSVIRQRSASLLEFVGLAEKRDQVLDAFSDSTQCGCHIADRRAPGLNWLLVLAVVISVVRIRARHTRNSLE
ncbi:MAG: ATP-binding cassette domain-containing protein [Deltaproteobacteria bacterium]|nr:ATP-binding cassette domain-containing protein [Deltaproteobacteria bacterium]